VNGGSVKLSYRFLDNETLELEMPNPLKEQQKALMQRLPNGRQMPQSHVPETLKGTLTIVKLTRTELVTHSSSEGRKHFRRSE
jgi:hypothetical protein